MASVDTADTRGQPPFAARVRFPADSEQLQRQFGARPGFLPPAALRQATEPLRVGTLVTKIGGVPYRPAVERWPTGPRGTPLAFLAQVNFTDSRDLTGESPGAVLLIFADNCNGLTFVHFEWRPLGLNGLITAEGIPAAPITVDPAATLFRQQLLQQFGHLHGQWSCY